MAMDRDISIAFEGIRDLVARGHARLEAKLDLSNDQFNKHLKEDAISFTKLEAGQTNISYNMTASEIRRKEESERKLKKYEQEQVRKDQFKMARLAGWIAIIAALIGVFGTSLFTLLEQRSSKEERAQMLLLQKKVLESLK